MKRFLSPRAVLIALVLAVFGAVVVSAQRTPTAAAAMSTAAMRLLDALNADQRKQATYPLESDEYLHWNFIPDETFPRNGLPLKSMTDSQQKLAHELLKRRRADLLECVKRRHLCGSPTVRPGMDSTRSRTRLAAPDAGCLTR